MDALTAGRSRHENDNRQRAEQHVLPSPPGRRDASRGRHRCWWDAQFCTRDLSGCCCAPPVKRNGHDGKHEHAFSPPSSPPSSLRCAAVLALCFCVSDAHFARAHSLSPKLSTHARSASSRAPTARHISRPARASSAPSPRPSTGASRRATPSIRSRRA